MNARRFLPGFLALFLLGAFAADKPKFFDQVVGINATSITLYKSPKKEVTFKLTGATKVIVDYKQAKIEDIKLGMKATVYRKGDTDEAGSISCRTIPGY